ncbi:PLP-dependent aminotransferase family protein [Pseudolysinimonas sp.]|uniref:aminotransferase-like domain-containing protein n=1 Tax=Pseudolysinimonas sp. TaxID=2680009 RepID=UPI0032644220
MGVNRLVRLLGEWRTGTQSLHDDLAGGLRSLIRSGALGSGTRLPAERSMGQVLGLSRNTVTKALDLLRADGLLQSRQGDGTYVTYSRQRSATRGDDRLSSFVGEAVSERIDLRSAALPGLPMVAEELNYIDGARLRSLVMTHGYLPAGLPELRDAIASYYTDLGLPTTPDHILVTSGAQQALRLTASLFVRPGAPVLVEEPTFRGALESLKSLGGRLIGVKSGVDGIDVDDLTSAIKAHSPVLLVVQSTVQNPVGSVLDDFRRSRIASLSNRFRLPVIDDATLADTIIDGNRRPIPLAAGGDLITTVGSVSKSFWGGLRVGWLRADPVLVSELAALKGELDLGTSLIAQLVSTRLLPQLESARDQRREMLSLHRQVALDKLTSELPDWQPVLPTGGGSMWVRLPSGSATTLAQRAEQLGVQFLPGPTFSASDVLDDHVRISYAVPPQELARGIELIAEAWRAYAATE